MKHSYCYMLNNETLVLLYVKQ